MDGLHDLHLPVIMGCAVLVLWRDHSGHIFNLQSAFLKGVHEGVRINIHACSVSMLRSTGIYLTWKEMFLNQVE